MRSKKRVVYLHIIINEKRAKPNTMQNETKLRITEAENTAIQPIIELLLMAYQDSHTYMSSEVHDIYDLHIPVHIQRAEMTALRRQLKLKPDLHGLIRYKVGARITFHFIEKSPADSNKWNVASYEHAFFGTLLITFTKQEMVINREDELVGTAWCVEEIISALTPKDYEVVHLLTDECFTDIKSEMDGKL